MTRRAANLQKLTEDEAQPINEAIRLTRKALLADLELCNANISQHQPDARLAIEIERLNNHFEDQLAINGVDHVGESFRLMTITADADGKLTMRAQFCESFPQPATVEQLRNMVQSFGSSFGTEVAGKSSRRG